MAGSDNFPRGSQEWHDAWTKEEQARYDADVASSSGYHDPETGANTRRAQIEFEHSNRTAAARRLRYDYTLVHHESAPGRPGWWERLLYGARPTSTGRSVAHAIVLLAVPIAVWIAAMPIIGGQRAAPAAAGGVVVVAWVMLKRNLALVALVATAAVAAYAFSPTAYHTLVVDVKAEFVPHWIPALVVIFVAVGVAGIQNIRYAWGQKLRYPADPRLDKFVRIAGIVCLVGLVPTIIFLKWAACCPGIPGLLLLWAFLSGIPQFAAVVVRGSQEAVRGMSTSYLELRRSAANAHSTFGMPFSARSWAALHEAGPEPR